MRLRDVTTDRYIAKLPASLPEGATHIHAGRPARVTARTNVTRMAAGRSTFIFARLEYLDADAGSHSAPLGEINAASLCTGCGRKMPSCKCWTAYDVAAARGVR